VFAEEMLFTQKLGFLYSYRPSAEAAYMLNEQLKINPNDKQVNATCIRALGSIDNISNENVRILNDLIQETVNKDITDQARLAIVKAYFHLDEVSKSKELCKINFQDAVDPKKKDEEIIKNYLIFLVQNNLMDKQCWLSYLGTMTNKYIYHSKISEKKFREIIRYFSHDIEASKIAALTGISRPTINRILKSVRQRIAEFCESESPFEAGEIEIDESYFGARRVRGIRGRGARGKHIVFGIIKRGGKVYTRVVTNCSAAKLLPIIRDKVTAD